VSRTLTTFQAILLGTLTLTGVALIAATIFAVASRTWFWNDALHVRAGFANVQGVEVGTKVRLRGLDAGEVEALEAPASTGALIELRLRINGKYKHLVRKNATVQIVSVGMLGGKAVEIDPGTESTEVVEEGALLASNPTTEVTDVLKQVQATLSDVSGGKGKFGTITDEMVTTLRSFQSAAQSIQADAEAMKKLPFVGKYVEDPRGVLDRPGYECNRKWFPEDKLFEPRRAVLTRQGERELEGIGDWLEGLLQHRKSELVVVAYADPKENEASARKWTQEQSKAVLSFLHEKYNKRFLVFSYRQATSLGMGTKPSPTRDNANLPAPRIEVLVYVPQG
jgi:hypothetical protein